MKPPSSERHLANFAYLLRAAREGLQRGNLDDALTMLVEANKQAVGNRQRISQVQEIEREVEKRREGRESGIQQRLFEIRRCLLDGALMMADRLLFQAIELYGLDGRFEELRRHLERSHLQDLESDVRSMMQQALELSQARQDVAAMELINKAQAVAPPQGATLLQELEATAEQIHLQSQTHRQQRLEGAKQNIDQHLNSFDLQAARAVAVGIEGDLGSPEAITSLRRYLKMRISEGIHSAIHAANQTFQAAEFGHAIEHLRQALALKPDDPWLQERLQLSVDHQLKQEKERQHDPEWTGSLSAIQEAVAHQKFASAEQLLQTAMDRWGDGASLSHLRQRLETERGDSIRALLEAARQAHRQGEQETAREHLAEALRIDPKDSSAMNLAEVFARPKNDMKLSEAPPEATAAVAELHRLCAEGQFLEAWRKVQTAIGSFGELESLVTLQRRIAQELLDGF